VKDYFRIAYYLIQQTISTALDRNVSLLAAGLAFFACISVAPLMVIAIAIGGFFFGDATAMAEMHRTLSIEVGPGVADMFVSMAAQARQFDNLSIATTVSMLFLAWGATRTFAEVRSALHGLWDIPPPSDTFKGAVLEYLRTRFFAAVGVLVVGILFVLLLGTRIALSLTSGALGEFNLLGLPLPLWTVIEMLVSLSLITLIIYLTFRFMPARRPGNRALIIGSLTTAVLLIVGQFAVAAYLTHGGVDTAYGAAGSLILFLFWAYYSSMVFLFGARLTHLVGRREWRAALGLADAEPATQLTLDLDHVAEKSALQSASAAPADDDDTAYSGGQRR
jgi:membrane protein